MTAASSSIPAALVALRVVACLLALAAPVRADVTPRVLRDGEARVHFSLTAFGWLRLHGDFPRVAGTVALDDAGRKADVELAADVGAVDAGAAPRNAFLRSETVFDAERYPQIRFHSTRARFDDGRLRGVVGILSLHGVEHEVEWTVEPDVCVPGPGCPLRASMTLHRSDYAMVYGQPLVGDEVELVFELERR